MPVLWKLLLFILISFLGVFLVPFALLRTRSTTSIRESSGAGLPVWASWWDDPLNTMWGDKYWRKNYPARYRSWLWMYLWYLRNPATGFGCQVLSPWGEIVQGPNKAGIIWKALCGDQVIRMIYYKTSTWHIKIGTDLTNWTPEHPRCFWPFAVEIRYVRG